MSRYVRLSVACLAAGTALSACRPDEVITSPEVPTAGVRFINAVPDSAGAFGMDMRFVDLVENNMQFRITFRGGPSTSAGVVASTQYQYKPARAGARKFTVFLSDSIQSIASTKLAEATPTLDAEKNYTYIMWGSGRRGTMKLGSWTESVTVPAGKVCLRVINATEAPIDVRTYVTGGTAPAAATFPAVAGLSASAHICTFDPASMRFNVRAVGATTDLFADITALPGTAATSTAGAGGKLDISSTPGSTVAGSAISLVVYPATTAGSRAANFTTAGGAFIWDARPPRGF